MAFTMASASAPFCAERAVFFPPRIQWAQCSSASQVRDLEQSSRDELIRQIETNSAAARLSPGLSGSNAGRRPAAHQGAAGSGACRSQESSADRPDGRFTSAPTSIVGRIRPHDIELRRDDELTIPKQPGFVLVTGQVYNATALTFIPGKTAAWYLSHAGGANATANRKEIFIIRANGSVVGRRSGEWIER